MKITYFGQKYKSMAFNSNFDGIASINMNLFKLLKVKKNKYSLLLLSILLNL